MRKFYIYIALLFMANSLFSQTAPVQHQFNFRGVQKYLSADSSYFQQNKFILGWHWNTRKRISEAMLSNQQDIFRNHQIDFTIDSNCLFTLKPIGYSHAVGDELFSVRAMQFEPTLNLNPTEPYKLVVRQGDTTRPIFGFLNRRGRILTDPNDPNFNRLIIDSAALINQVVL